MATQFLITTTTPVDLKDTTDGLSLVEGETYTVQNVGNHPVYIAQLAAVPTDNNAHVIERYGLLEIDIEADGMYCWSAANSSIVVTEAQ